MPVLHFYLSNGIIPFYVGTFCFPNDERNPHDGVNITVMTFLGFRTEAKMERF